MKNANSKNLILGNMALWLMAALINPVSRLIPTGSGAPPKIYEVLIPMFIIFMGLASTSFLRAALKDDDRD